MGNKVLESAGLLIDNPVKRGQCESKKDQENLGKILNQIRLVGHIDETNSYLPYLVGIHESSQGFDFVLHGDRKLQVFATIIEFFNDGTVRKSAESSRYRQGNAGQPIFMDTVYRVLPNALISVELILMYIEDFKEGRGFKTSAELVLRKIKRTESPARRAFMTASKIPEHERSCRH